MRCGAQRASCVDNIWKNLLFSFLLLRQISKRHFTFLMSPLFSGTYLGLYLRLYDRAAPRLNEVLGASYWWSFIYISMKNIVRFAWVFPCVYMASHKIRESLFVCLSILMWYYRPNVSVKLTYPSRLVNERFSNWTIIQALLSSIAILVDLW